MSLVGLLLKLLPPLLTMLPTHAGSGRHLAIQLTLRAGVVMAIGSLASMAVLAAVAAMVLGLAEEMGYPAALGVSAIVLLATAGALAAALVLVDRRSDRRAAAVRDASLEAIVAPLTAVSRQIAQKPMQSALLALAAGALLGVLRRR
ncbi:MAG: hypothetical protein U1E52_02455 [Geminicoccaceae bacterium]